MHHAESITPIPKVCQLAGPQVVGEVVVHVDAHDANLVAEGGRCFGTTGVLFCWCCSWCSSCCGCWSNYVLVAVIIVVVLLLLLHCVLLDLVVVIGVDVVAQQLIK